MITGVLTKLKTYELTRFKPIRLNKITKYRMSRRWDWVYNANNYTVRITYKKKVNKIRPIFKSDLTKQALKGF